MPKEIADIKQFIQISRRKDARTARIKRNKKTGITKFKIRCKKDLCTLVLRDSEKADKLKQSLPPGLAINEISEEKKKKTKKT